MMRVPGTSKRYSTLASLLLVSLLGCGETSESPDGANAADPALNVAKLDNQEDSTDAVQAVANEQGLSTDFYTVDHYDIAADPAEQLQATLERAKRETQKTVLLQVGGDWCGWCKKMSQFMASNQEANRLLNEHYVVQKVTFDQKNENEAFLSGYPKISGYPHLFVLDADGKLLHSQDTAELESKADPKTADKKNLPPYDAEKFVAFLKAWSPK